MRSVFPFLDRIAPNGRADETQPWDEILVQTPNFVVVPTVGALVEGWLLIVSKDPYVCMGAIDAGLHDELSELLVFCSTAVRECFGAAAIFEHGPSSTGLRVGCGVDHAHVHVLPAPGGLIAGTTSVSQVEFGWHRV